MYQAWMLDLNVKGKQVLWQVSDYITRSGATFSATCDSKRLKYFFLIFNFFCEL